jgi:hypothetical protein
MIKKKKTNTHSDKCQLLSNVIRLMRRDNLHYWLGSGWHYTFRTHSSVTVNASSMFVVQLSIDPQKDNFCSWQVPKLLVSGSLCNSICGWKEAFDCVHDVMYLEVIFAIDFTLIFFVI